jgi:hypothetical protein
MAKSCKKKHDGAKKKDGGLPIKLPSPKMTHPKHASFQSPFSGILIPL